MADGPDGPLPDPSRLGAVTALHDPEILLGWVVRPDAPAWFSSGRPISTLLVGPGTRRAVRSGAIRPLTTRLSATPRLLAGRLRPAVAVVAGVADGPGFRYAPGLGWAPAAVRHAQSVVVEVAPGRPVAGSPRIEGPIVEVVERADPPDPPPTSVTGATEARIGELVAGLVPEGATVQWGPGAIGAAAVAALPIPVAVSSGLVTDELVTLADRGLLAGTAQAAYLWGGTELHGLVARGRLRMRPVDVTHDLTALSARPRLVAINTALEVGLDGAVNVEGTRQRPVAGPGGHPDFCAGASRSPGGVAIVALRATFAGRSAIVAQPEIVSTAAGDVDVVVTEHGVADLRGLAPAQRAERMVAIANPADRPALQTQAAAWIGGHQTRHTRIK